MIVLIDSYYPFRGGDVFLKAEIACASKRKERIVIYPIEKKGDGETYSLPEGIAVRQLPGRFAAGKVIASYLRAMVSPMLWQDVADVIKRGFSPKKLAAALYYAAKTNLYYSAILGDLKKLHNGEERLVFYAYWMHIHACIAAKLKKYYKNAAFITRCHGYDLYEFRSSVGFLPGRRLIFTNADRILSVSQKGRSYLEDRYPYIPRKRLSVSYLGTEEHGRNPRGEGAVRIVSCSNAVPVKRIDLLIKALAEIKDLSFEWVHYGSGELLDDLKKQAKESVSPNIRVRFEGYVDNETLMTRYAREHIDFFVNVSASEGLPVSVMEAMSFGIPVIATDVGGTGEIVSNGVNGFLVDRDISPGSLSEQLVKALTMDETQAASMRHQARLTWEEKFNSDKNYGHFYDGLG